GPAVVDRRPRSPSPPARPVPVGRTASCRVAGALPGRRRRRPGDAAPGGPGPAGFSAVGGRATPGRRTVALRAPVGGPGAPGRPTCPTVLSACSPDAPCPLGAGLSARWGEGAPPSPETPGPRPSSHRLRPVQRLADDVRVARVLGR